MYITLLWLQERNVSSDVIAQILNVKLNFQHSIAEGFFPRMDY